jgi:hypothetical protein
LPPPNVALELSEGDFRIPAGLTENPTKCIVSELPEEWTGISFRMPTDIVADQERKADEKRAL